MNVRVVGEQFTWTFYYPGGPGGKETASPELYLPEETPVKFTIQSKDVIHDFWVPAFRQKIDAVPGIDTELPHHDDRREGQLPGGLRRALRARALDHAPDGARGPQGRLRQLALRPSAPRRPSNDVP